MSARGSVQGGSGPYDGLTLALARRLVEAPLPPDPDPGYAALLRAATLSALDPAVDAVVELGLGLSGPGDVLVPGRDDHLAVRDAAYAIGVAAGLGLSAIGGREQGSPAAFAAACATGADRGTDPVVIHAAFRAGSAFAADVAEALGEPSGWDPAATADVLGAAVAAALVTGLDADGLARALGFAASSVVGLGLAAGTPVGSLAPGKAAANGVLAAALAEAGSTASTRVLEAPRGLFGVIGDPAGLSTLMEGIR